MSDLRWTTSNALSVLRLLLTVPTVWAVMEEWRTTAIILMVCAFITDILDGYLARRFREISELGKVLDPLADKVFVAAVVIALLAGGLLPLWFVLAVLGRDLLILSGGIYVERKTGRVLPSNYPGKAAALMLSLSLLLIVAGVGENVITVLIAVAGTLLAVSLLLYAVRAVRELRSGTDVSLENRG